MTRKLREAVTWSSNARHVVKFDFQKELDEDDYLISSTAPTVTETGSSGQLTIDQVALNAEAYTDENGDTVPALHAVVARITKSSTSVPDGTYKVVVKVHSNGGEIYEGLLPITFC